MSTNDGLRASYWARQIRADLKKRRDDEAATLCPHHINRTRATCRECERAETSEESNA